MIAGNLKLKGNHISQPSSGALKARASGSEEPRSGAPALRSTPAAARCYGYLIIVIDDIRSKECARNNTGACHARVVLFMVREVHKVERSIRVG